MGRKQNDIIDLDDVNRRLEAGEEVTLTPGVTARGRSIRLYIYYQGRRIRETLRLPLTLTNIQYAIKTRAAVQRDIEITGTFDYERYFPHGKNAGKFGIARSRLTIKESLTTWLENKKDDIALSSYQDYKKSINNILIPAFGDTLLVDLGVRQIQEWVDARTSSVKRTRNVLTALHGVLNEAYSAGEIAESPLDRITFKKSKPKVNIDPETGEELDGDNQPIHPFSYREIEKILSACEDIPLFYHFIMFAVSSGLRTSELIALHWRHIDFANDIIRVRVAFVRGEFKGPKTVAGRRDVKLLEPARRALMAIRELTGSKKDGPVFLNPKTLKPWTGDKQIRESFWRPALERAEVQYRYPYQLRHTYASTMLSAGENPTWLASQMGHKDWSEIRRRYAKWIPDTQHREGTLVESMWHQKLGHHLKDAS